MIYSRPASGMVFPKPRLAGPSGIIIQQDRRFGNTFGNGFEIAVQLDITACTFLSWVLYLIFIPALYEIHGTITKKESGLTSVLKTEQGGEAPKPLSKNSIAPPSGESKSTDEAVKKTVRF